MDCNVTMNAPWSLALYVVLLPWQDFNWRNGIILKTLLLKEATEKEVSYRSRYSLIAKHHSSECFHVSLVVKLVRTFSIYYVIRCIFLIISYYLVM